MPDSNGNGAIPISRMIKAMIDSGEFCEHAASVLPSIGS